MKESVWAIYFHKLSTDEKPIHHLCDENCPYNKAQRENRVYEHKNSIPALIMYQIKPIFKDLSNPVLLSKCLEGYTQNANESFNKAIWRFCPKNKNHGVRVVNQAVGLAVSIFNDGASSGFSRVMREMGLTVGQNASSCFRVIDANRIKNAQRQALAATKEARITNKRKKSNFKKTTPEVEDESYSSGSY